MTAPDPATIAASLNEAQRRAVVKIGDPKRPFGGMWRTGLGIEDNLDLKERGLVKWTIPAGTLAPMCSLTPRGRALCQRLMEADRG